MLHFRLQIVAKDKGTTPLTSSPLVIDIEVLDANDNSPEFTKDNYTRGISEAISLGSIVEEVQAIDQDIGLNAEVVYSLLTGHDYFKIDNKTGMLMNIVQKRNKIWHSLRCFNTSKPRIYQRKVSAWFTGYLTV